MDFASLSKDERKKLKREIERKEESGRKSRARMVKWLIIVIILALVGSGGWLLYREMSKPLPGQKIAELGRDHVPKEKWEAFTYNSNPPTSGPHDEIWTKAGVYSDVEGKGYLLHSLEHGYVEIHYSCDVGKQEAKSKQPEVTVSGQMEASNSGQASPSASLDSPGWKSQECEDLKKQLADLANDKKLWKLIVVANPTIDTKIALAAWTWLEKLDAFDKDKIVAFIDVHRNHGPEQTME